jgi:seryl-tRNA synthetase
MANHCDKRFRQLVDKQFKNYRNKAESIKSKSSNTSLSLEEKTKLIEGIKEQSNEGLTQIVKIILKECPKGIEDIDNEKLQIKIDLLDYRTYELINQYLEKNNGGNILANNEKGKVIKK